MHFKPFWMPCLHIKFFTSAPIPELTAVENFTKRWNGMLGSLSDFKNQFKSRKVLIRLEWNPSIRNEEKKCLSDQNSCFRKEPSFQNIVFLCCCSSEFLSEIRLICCRIEFFWKIFLSDKLALTDALKTQWVVLKEYRTEPDPSHLTESKLLSLEMISSPSNTPPEADSSDD
jgi:hypothetical protein